MQAQLEITRRPSLVAIVAFVASLLLAGSLGYALKAPATFAGPSRAVVVHSLPGSSNQADGACVWTDHQKAC